MCIFAETLLLYQAFWKDVQALGTLVDGSRGRGLVRNPSLSGLQQARTDLIKLSRAIPLYVGKDAVDADLYVDKLLSEVGLSR